MLKEWSCQYILQWSCWSMSTLVEWRGWEPVGLIILILLNTNRQWYFLVFFTYRLWNSSHYPPPCGKLMNIQLLRFIKKMKLMPTTNLIISLFKKSTSLSQPHVKCKRFLKKTRNHHFLISATYFFLDWLLVLFSVTVRVLDQQVLQREEKVVRWQNPSPPDIHLTGLFPSRW